ncbi:MAG: MFS transporter, partial [Acidimicrobiales bacterium]
MSALGIDLSPWRASASFRRLYVAGFVTALGGQATYVTVPFQLKALTNSPLVVGTLGLVELVPIVVLGLWGGLLADRVDRRRLIVILEASTLVAIGGLVVNALARCDRVIFSESTHAALLT